MKESVIGNSRSFSQTTFNESKSIYSCYGFLESRQEPIKRTSLNTRILIVVFNKILIPQDSFFEDNCNSSKDPSSEICDYIPRLFYLKIHIFIFIHFFILENMKTIIVSYDVSE